MFCIARLTLLALIICFWPATAHAGLLWVYSRPAPVTLAGDGSLSLNATLASISGDETPLHRSQFFPVTGGSVALSFGPATSGTLATGLTWASGTVTVTGNGHVLDLITLGLTVLAPRTDLNGVPFWAFDATPFSSTLAPELAAYFGVFRNGSSLLGGNLRVVDGVLTAINGIQTGGVVFDLPAGTMATPEPGSLVLLTIGLAAVAMMARGRQP